MPIYQTTFWIRRAIFFSLLLTLAIFSHFFDIPCPFRSLTGIPCPTCGLTRSFAALTRLDFVRVFLLSSVDTTHFSSTLPSFISGHFYSFKKRNQIFQSSSLYRRCNYIRSLSFSALLSFDPLSYSFYQILHFI
jgi:hypothetical protein